jgi:tight adherence protein C
MNMQWILLALVFLTATGLIFGVMQWVNRDEALKRRLGEITDTPSKDAQRLEGNAEWHAKVVKVAGPMARLSAPQEGWEASSLRVRFMRAGLREASWPAVFFATKTLLALGLPMVVLLYMGTSHLTLGLNKGLMLLILALAVGYYLPNIVLSRLVTRRTDNLQNALPDALDLMIVCVEAGLGLDAAMNRAAGEIGMRSKPLSDELNLLALELRMGVRREQALHNLAMRSGVDDMSSFVAMLVQADRFGTNVAEALRVQAETMRTHRRLRAEERAAKIPLKLLFPLIFFIFPSLMVVLMGPAMLSVYRVLLPSMGGR